MQKVSSPTLCWRSPKCRWESPDPQRANCGFTIHAGQRPAIIFPVDLEIHRNKGASSPTHGWRSPYAVGESPECRWGSPDPQRSNCGFAIHAGQRPAIIFPVDLEIHRN